MAILKFGSEKIEVVPANECTAPSKAIFNLESGSWAASLGDGIDPTFAPSSGGAGLTFGGRTFHINKNYNDYISSTAVYTNPIIKLNAAANNSITDEIENNIWTGLNNYEVPTTIDNPFNNNTYCIDLTNNNDSNFLTSSEHTLKENTYDNLTVTSWVKLNVSGNAFRIGNGEPSSNPYADWSIMITDTTAYFLYQNGGYSDINRSATLPNVLDVNQWYFMEIQFTPNLFTLFIDGTQVVSISIDKAAFSCKKTFFIGNWFWNGGYGRNKSLSKIYNLCVFDKIIHTEDYQRPNKFI